MTLQEYYATPETTLPQELIDGVCHVADAPFVPHQRVAFRMARLLAEHTEPRGLGEVLIAPIDVVLDPQRPVVLQPDLLFVSRRRGSIVTERVHGAPDLVVEVLSPHPRVGRLDQHIQEYARAGVREIWVYDQIARRLDILACEGGHLAGRTAFGTDDAIRSNVLPSFDQPLVALTGW